MQDMDARRSAHTQPLFREVNERIAALSNQYTHQPATRGFVCECLNASCCEFVVLARDEYARMREDGNRFFVVPGHEDLAVETVVEATDRYLVVTKLGVATSLAEEPA